MPAKRKVVSREFIEDSDDSEVTGVSLHATLSCQYIFLNLWCFIIRKGGEESRNLFSISSCSSLAQTLAIVF